MVKVKHLPVFLFFFSISTEAYPTPKVTSNFLQLIPKKSSFTGIPYQSSMYAFNVYIHRFSPRS